MSMPFSDEDLQEPVKNLIEGKISKMLSSDGGAIKLLKIKDGIVYVQLQGACVGCAASGSTMKFIVEKQLKEYIHPEIQVVNILPGMEDKLPNDWKRVVKKS